jgi:hypothetical protein
VSSSRLRIQTSVGFRSKFENERLNFIQISNVNGLVALKSPKFATGTSITKRTSEQGTQKTIMKKRFEVEADRHSVSGYSSFLACHSLRPENRKSDRRFCCAGQGYSTDLASRDSNR